MSTKYIFVTGGVTSSLGKGIICSSLGRLLVAQGLRVTIIKLDPYINVDPGTMNPYEHGEVYVTEDGAETDLDLGHYERFLDVTTSQANNVTTGRIYYDVISKERKGLFEGKTVQVVPHITDEIQSHILKLGDSGDYDVVLIEIGGTVGDIESLPYIEAVRQLKYNIGRQNTVSIHLTLIPYLAAAGELKTKPTQHSVKTLSESGLQPDILVCRSDRYLEESIKDKIAKFCNVDIEDVISSVDARTIYEVPMLMKKEGLDKRVIEKLNLDAKEYDLEKWEEFIESVCNPKGIIEVALVGKYVEHHDSYKSAVEAFIHAGAANECKVKIRWVQADHLNDKNVAENLQNISGILVGPGFGKRGVEGKILAANYARTNNIPFFGICLGMQCAVIEYARNVCGWENANSLEFDADTPYPIVELGDKPASGVQRRTGKMRLGSYTCDLKPDTISSRAYGAKSVKERHRHRYEINNNLRYKLIENGMVMAGMNPKRDFVEIIELPDHPWYVGVQFHPELKSTVKTPHPLFVSFVEAALKFSKSNDLYTQIENLEAKI